MKQYFTGFFTAVCLTSSIFFFVGAQKNHGDLLVSSLKIKDRYSASSITIESEGITMVNNKGKKLLSIGKGDVLGGSIRAFSPEGREMIYLGSNIDGDGGVIKIRNIFGEETGSFGTDINKNGIATLSDRYGEIGWVAFGKQ